MNIIVKLKTLCVGLLMVVCLPVLAGTTSTNGSTMSDSLITTKVKSELAANSVTQALTISVTTNNGVVTLSGTSSTPEAASAAVQIAESTKDVTNVDASNLTVTGNSQPLSDTYITAKVKGMFIKNNLFTHSSNISAATISVDTKSGVVYLSGTVRHHGEIKQAIRLAKSVDGVTNVVSTLTVSS